MGGLIDHLPRREEDEFGRRGADIDGSGMRRAVREDGGEVSDRGAIEYAGRGGVKHIGVPDQFWE
jgi:hypothetical protein